MDDQEQMDVYENVKSSNPSDFLKKLAKSSQSSQSNLERQIASTKVRIRRMKDTIRQKKRRLKMLYNSMTANHAELVTLQDTLHKLQAAVVPDSDSDLDLC